MIGLDKTRRTDGRTYTYVRTNRQINEHTDTRTGRRVDETKRTDNPLEVAIVYEGINIPLPFFFSLTFPHPDPDPAPSNPKSPF